MKIVYLTLGLFIAVSSCISKNDSKNLEKEQLQAHNTKQESTVNGNRKLNDEKTVDKEKSKKIRDFTFTILNVDEENLEGFLFIENNITNNEIKVPIEVVEIESANIDSYVKFEDFDFDGKDELLIELGEPARMKRGFRILDYNTLEPKAIFRKTKQHIFIGSSDDKSDLTNIINAGYRSGYEIDKNIKLIQFGGACGADCTNIEIYTFNNGIYNLKTSKFIENGVTTIQQSDNEFIIDDLLTLNSQKDIEKRFGKENVVTDIVFPSNFDPEPVEGAETPYGTILFNRTDNMVTFFWKDKKNLRDLESIVFSKLNSKWQTKEGISIGTDIEQLEKINKSEFEFYGFEEFLRGGLIFDWGKGILEKKSIKISLKPSNNTPTRLFEDGIKIKSSSTIAKNGNIFVGEITMWK
ncbi:hypothetical protein [Lacinutrix mariniflava]|uniref:hypothetical protein n=1 Tax=Lacinutrix mariniflava TaxID=342955 RepID=UPI0006E229BB|nr:hypothetical protein [Lacinutrix mariniflava]